MLAKDRIEQLVDIRQRCHIGLQNTAKRLDEQYSNERRMADVLKPGVDKCWLKLDGINLRTLKVKHTGRRRKFNPLWYGPFDIVARTGVLSYRLKLPADVFNAGLHDVFHVKNLRKYDPNKVDTDVSSTLPEIEARDVQYEVEEILQHKTENSINKFLVSWKGFHALTSASFVTEAELRRNASELLEEYMSLHNIESDGTVLSDDEADSPQGSAHSPAQNRKRNKTTAAGARQKRRRTKAGASKQ